MGLRTLAKTIANSRPISTLLALVTTFAGVGLLIDRPKGIVVEWLALPLLAIGGAFFMWIFRRVPRSSAETPNTLASRLLHRLTWGGRLVGLFPAFGAAIIIADLAYNWMQSASPSLQTEDTIALLAAGTLLGYGFVPERYARERDFTLLFFVLLNAFLVAPLLITRVYYADLNKSVDVYSWVALAPQTSGVLTLLGVSNQVHTVSGSTAPGLTFTPEHFSVQVTVVITTACSGIYSFGVFASAFVAFELTEFKRPSTRMWALIVLGFATSYLANVLRMVVIILVGYYSDTPGTDLQNMLLAHSYLGWIIFLGWITLFWSLLLRFTPQESNADVPHELQRRGVLCGICRRELTPALHGYRCECGSFFHVACASQLEACSNCQRPLKSVALERAQLGG